MALKTEACVEVVVLWMPELMLDIIEAQEAAIGS